MNRIQEDYIAEIYKLQRKKNSSITVTEVASKLEISKASVSEMIKKLKKSKYIDSKIIGVSLTKLGIKKAQYIIRKHRIIEVFLKKMLKIDTNFHDEAHKMEHVISDETTEKLNELLNKPKTCPEGSEIPDENVEIEKLCELSAGDKAKILFSNVKNKSSLNRLRSLGIIPGSKVEITRKVRNGPIMIKIKNSEIAIGKDLAESIFIERLS